MRAHLLFENTCVLKGQGSNPTDQNHPTDSRASRPRDHVRACARPARLACDHHEALCMPSTWPRLTSPDPPQPALRNLRAPVPTATRCQCSLSSTHAATSVWLGLQARLCLLEASRLRHVVPWLASCEVPHALCDTLAERCILSALAG